MDQKSTGTAYLLMLFSLIGFAGIQRFYLGKIGTGILYLLTWGLFGFGLIYDLFTLPNQVRMANLLRSGANPNVVVHVNTKD
ncbi:MULTISPECIES: TM2 domain-containing protein [unclassified Bacillus (in: firmicutes)]|uniref:TM2 domain-containing protein n=1 Tax=unclassified Bacillus (in: firmicutes) TaxID=185979 RepID=UPI0008EF09D9|nr:MULTISPECIES: TM2 domain-containing protein [unclassified Bacillus (in: firmicutes)]SFB12766.1 TM2 domain-containing protein [Bacillus sp. UNCCL13]SFQ90202.1 TM2 domain-containing protein [Bacillus sp. cl95]